MKIFLKIGAVNFMSEFSKEEKQRFMLRKHIKEHLFEYILDLIMPVLLTMVILRLCGAQEYIYGILVSLAYSFGRIMYNIHYYKKQYKKQSEKENGLEV